MSIITRAIRSAALGRGLCEALHADVSWSVRAAMSAVDASSLAASCIQRNERENRRFSAGSSAPSTSESESTATTGSTANSGSTATFRTGTLAVKAGMTQEFDHHGQRIPLTVLWLDDVQVTQIKPYSATASSLQLGIGSKRRKQIPASLAGHFDAAGVPYKRKTKEFRVSNDAILPVGHTISASHFVPGQYVDVSGTSIGKGFQGVMKRWGFAGQPASHGNSLAHRKGGSTGQCQDPGKVFKGKKMPGRMGGVRATTMGCLVWRVDVDRGLVYVKGQVPGHKGNFVEVRDSRKGGGGVNRGVQLPVPTGALEGGVFVAGRPEANPFD